MTTYTTDIDVKPSTNPGPGRWIEITSSDGTTTTTIKLGPAEARKVAETLNMAGAAVLLPTAYTKPAQISYTA